MEMWLCRSCMSLLSSEDYWNFFYPRRDAKRREEHLFLIREGTRKTPRSEPRRGAKDNFLFATKGREGLPSRLLFWGLWGLGCEFFGQQPARKLAPWRIPHFSDSSAPLKLESSSSMETAPL